MPATRQSVGVGRAAEVAVIERRPSRAAERTHTPHTTAPQQAGGSLRAAHRRRPLRRTTLLLLRALLGRAPAPLPPATARRSQTSECPARGWGLAEAAIRTCNRRRGADGVLRALGFLLPAHRTPAKPKAQPWAPRAAIDRSLTCPDTTAAMPRSRSRSGEWQREQSLGG